MRRLILSLLVVLVIIGGTIVSLGIWHESHVVRVELIYGENSTYGEIRLSIQGFGTFTLNSITITTDMPLSLFGGYSDRPPFGQLMVKSIQNITDSKFPVTVVIPIQLSLKVDEGPGFCALYIINHATCVWTPPYNPPFTHLTLKIDGSWNFLVPGSLSVEVTLAWACLEDSNFPLIFPPPPSHQFGYVCGYMIGVMQ